MHNESNIPDKMYFKIGEASELTGLDTHVLRFWETEFKKINPKRTRTGQRLYRRKDLETILAIKTLLYEKKYTIKGAKKIINAAPGSSLADHRYTIDTLKKDLAELKALLD